MNLPSDHPHLPASGVRACRVCGCTEFDACWDEKAGTPCYWVAADLCSACVAPQDEDGHVMQLIEVRPPMPLRSRLALSALGTAVMLGVVAATMTVPL